MPFRRSHEPSDHALDHGILRIEGLGELDVRVVTVSVGGADLALVGTGSGPQLDGHNAELVMWGDTTFTGRLQAAETADRVRFLRDAKGRREWTRIEADLNAVLVPESLDTLWRARVRDIGAGGVLLSHAEGLPLGARLHLELDLAAVHERGLWMPGRVIRAPRGDERAVSFEDADAASRLRVQRYVLEEQMRRLRHAALGDDDAI